MYHSFEIKNFKCFDNLIINNFKRVNLIAGLNNVGKTALLEGLFLHCGQYNPTLTMSINAFRGIEMVKLEFGVWQTAPFNYFFYNLDTSKEIILTGKFSVKDERVVKSILSLKIATEHSKIIKHGDAMLIPVTDQTTRMLILENKIGNKKLTFNMIIDPQGIRVDPTPPAPHFPAVFLASKSRMPLFEDAERYGKLELYGEHDLLLEILQVIEPRLKRISVVVASGLPTIHGDIGIGSLVPLPLMGEGVAKLASIVLAIGTCPNGVVLIDEMENGFHHSILNKLWKAIDKASSIFNTQIIATTHSFECIRSAHEAFAKNAKYEFCLHRLEKIDGAIKAISYDKATLSSAIESGMEVR